MTYNDNMIKDNTFDEKRQNNSRDDHLFNKYLLKNKSKNKSKNESVREFYNSLYKESEIINLRFIHSDGKTENQFIKINQGKEISEIYELVKTYQKNNYNGYFTPIPRKGKNTKTLSRLNTFFIDLDSKDFSNRTSFDKHVQELNEKLMNMNLFPSFVVNSGNGLHYYWTLDDSSNIDDNYWRKIQESLINFSQSDPVIKDTQRLLRIPYSKNLKDIDNPKNTEILFSNPDFKYSPENFQPILRIFELQKDIEEQGKDSLEKEHQQLINEDEFREVVLKNLEENSSGMFDSYSDFLSLILSSKYEGISYNRIDGILKKSTNYNYNSNLRSYNSSKPRGDYTFGTIYHYSKRSNERSLKEKIKELIERTDDKKVITDKENYLKWTFPRLLTFLISKVNWKVDLDKDNYFVYTRKNKEYYKELSSEERKKEIRKIFPKLYPSTIGNLHKSLIEDYKRNFDRKKFLESRKIGIPFLNGVFNLKSGSFRDYKEDDHFLNPIKHKFNVEYNNENIDWFKKKVSEWVNEDNSEWFVKLLSYILFIHPNEEQVWINFYGQGSNGKSLCLWLLEEILGQDKVQGTDLSKINRFTTSSFVGKWLIIGRDSDSNVSGDGVSVIKTFSGDERLLVEPKGKQHFDDYVQGKLIVSTNELIKSKDNTHSWYRRIVTVPFPNKFNKNEKVKSEFRSKLSDIIPYLCQLSYEYKNKNELLTDNIPKDFEYLHRETQKENDTVLNWIDSTFQKDSSEELDINKLKGLDGTGMTEIYGLYKEWFIVQFGEKRKPISLRKFGGENGELMKHISYLFNYERTKQKRVLKIIESNISV